VNRVAHKPLPFRRLKIGAGFHQPASYKPVQVDSPAIETMTDLQRVPAATTTPDATLAQATQVMVARSVRLLLVVNPLGEILGLITARDTSGERPIKHIKENGGKHADLKVRDCMTPLEAIDVLTMDDVLRASVGHIITTLEDAGRQHAVAVDRDPAGEERIRGIFSISQIARQLGMPLQQFEVATTFAEIRARLAA
jgi:Mg2+/Co2+ transporter CorB